MLRFKSLLIILLSALVVAGIAFAGIALLGTTKPDGDEEVSLSNVPAAVLDAANKAVPGGEIEEVEKEVEDGEVIYDVEKLVDGVSCEIEVTADGSVREVEKGGKDKGDKEDDDEEEVALSDAPDRVLDAANEPVPGGEVKEVEKEVEDGVVIYEVEKDVDGVKYEIEVAEDGTVKKVEKEDDDEGDDDD